MFLDKYPSCEGCPVFKYCGTMVASTLLCVSENIGIVANEPVQNNRQTSNYSQS